MDWRKEFTVEEDFNFSDSEEQVLTAEEDFLLEKEQRLYCLLDIAKYFLNPVEAEILFLCLKMRRNKDISLILNIQEPEVARFKSIIVKKCIIYKMFKYHFDIMQFHPLLVSLLNLNEKQSEILMHFFQFRSLSYIGDKVNSKSSNMHRSLNAIKQKVETFSKDIPELNMVLLFFKYSKYIINSNENKSIVQQLI